MDQPDNELPPSKPGPSPFQFRLVTLMLVTVLACVLAALFGGLVRNDADGDYKSRFILLTLIVPTGLVVLLSLLRWIFRPRKRRRPRW